MVKKLITDTHYVVGGLVGILAEYASAFMITKKLNDLGYSPELIAPLAATAKSFSFITFNTGYYALVNGWEKGKVIFNSNLKGFGAGWLSKGLLHYGLMYVGVKPELAMMVAYPIAGVIGTGVKLYQDNKNL